MDPVARSKSKVSSDDSLQIVWVIITICTVLYTKPDTHKGLLVSGLTTLCGGKVESKKF